MKKIEDLINKEIDDVLNAQFINSKIIIDISEFDDFDEDLINWCAIPFKNIIADNYIRYDQSLVLTLEDNFVNSHNESVKRLNEMEELDTIREYWNSRF